MEMVRGRKRPIEMASAGILKPTKAEAKLDVSIHNRFDIEVIDATTGKAKQKAYAENVICNQLWSRMFSSTAGNRTWNQYIHFGSGTGAPSASDTSLFTFVAAVANTNPTRINDAANGVSSIRHQIQLSETQYVGVTLREVGIGFSTSSSSLCTHAMLKDMNGNQISIAKTDTDIINIYATVFAHYNPDGYDDGTIRVIPYYAGSPSRCFLIEWVLGMADAPYYTGGSPMTYAPGGHGNISATAGMTGTVNEGTKSFKATASRRNVSTWNISGGIGSVALCVTGGGLVTVFKVGGSWYPGTNIVGEAIGTGDGVTKDFKTAFGYANNATIYVDGLPESNATVDESPYNPSQVGIYFECVDENAKPSVSIWNPDASGTISGSTMLWVYNPNYEWGVVTFLKPSSVKVEVSDDCEVWAEILSGQSGTVSVPPEYQNSKYWRFTNTNASSQSLRNFVSGAPSNNIHFDSAPSNGAVITADYTTKTIAKDTNHVFDFEFTITVGEKIT